MKGSRTLWRNGWSESRVGCIQGKPEVTESWNTHTHDGYVLKKYRGQLKESLIAIARTCWETK